MPDDDEPVPPPPLPPCPVSQAGPNFPGLTLPQEEDARDKLLEELPFAIVLIDDHGRMEIVNKQTELLFGWSRYDMLGKPVEMLLPERLREAHIAYRQTFTIDPKIRQMGAGAPLMGLHRSGREIPLVIFLNSVPVAGAGVLAFAVIQKSRAGEGAAPS